MCFVHLGAPKDVLQQRVAHRADHFIPTALLDSQFATLEDLVEDELGAEIDISSGYHVVVAEAENYVRETLL